MIRVSDNIKAFLVSIKDNEEWKEVYSYITNLQERCAYLERSNDRREDTILGLRQELYEQEDYKSRCEKASVILNNIYMLDNVTITNNACEKIDKAINILQNGGDKLENI